MSGEALKTVVKKRQDFGNTEGCAQKDSVEHSIHIKTLLDDLNFFKDYCPRNLFSGRNSSPEKSLQKNRSIFGLENQSCDRRQDFSI